MFHLDSFPEDQWVDKGPYYLNISPQGTEGWFDARKGRLTGSNVAAAIEHSIFATPEQQAKYIAEIEEKIFSNESKEVMKHGTDTEPIARKWYENSRKVTVKEVGLAVPKWETRLGSSVDGIVISPDGVEEGIIEIKCPLKMYDRLSTHVMRKSKGWQPPKNYFGHIWPSHYIQMQTGLFVLDKQWCDYIVYATESNKVYVERIYKDEEHWNNFILPKIKTFLDDILNPLLKSYNQN
jgi:putative phage-type endonuclease